MIVGPEKGRTDGFDDGVDEGYTEGDALGLSLGDEDRKSTRLNSSHAT